MEPGREEKPALTVEKLLSDEIMRIVERNQNEAYLRKLLTRALILEEIMRCCYPGKSRGFIFVKSYRSIF